jgi:hypothetical protein
MIVLSFTGLGITPLSKHLFLDFLIVPAILCSLSTNKYYTFLTGLTWGVAIYLSPYYLSEYYPLFISIVPRISICLFAYYFFAEKSKQFSINFFKKSSVKARLMISVLIINVFKIIIEVVTSYFFNIHKHLGTYTVDIYKVHVFDIVFEKGLVEMVYLLLLTWLIIDKTINYERSVNNE